MTEARTEQKKTPNSSRSKRWVYLCYLSPKIPNDNAIWIATNTPGTHRGGLRCCWVRVQPQNAAVQTSLDKGNKERKANQAWPPCTAPQDHPPASQGRQRPRKVPRTQGSQSHPYPGGDLSWKLSSSMWQEFLKWFLQKWKPQSSLH